MGKAITYITILIFSMLFLMLFGLVQFDELSGGMLLKLVMNPLEIKSNQLYWLLFNGIFTLLVSVGAIALGAVQRVNMVDTVVASAATLIMANMFWDMLTIFNILRDNVGIIYAGLLVGPLIILGFLILIEWFRGKD